MTAPGYRPARKASGDFLVEVYEDHAEAVAKCPLPVEVRAHKAARYLDGCPGSTQGRAADNYAYAIAMSLCWGFLLPPEEAEEQMYDWGRKDTNVDTHGLCYPWTEAEIRCTARESWCCVSRRRRASRPWSGSARAGR